MFTGAFPSQILYANALMYQPAPLSRPLTWAVGLVSPHLVALNVGTALLQTAIAIGIVVPRTTRPALAASVVWSLVVWVGGEGLGGMATGTALVEFGAPGAALLYVLAALLVLPRPGGPSGPLIADRGWLGGRGALAAWTGLFLLAAGLHFQTRFTAGGVLAYNFQTAAQNQAGPLIGLDYRLARFGYAHGLAISIGLATVEAALAAGVWWRRIRPLAVAVGLVLMVAFWVVGQALGGVVTGLSTDPSSAPLVLILGLALLRQHGAAGRVGPLAGPTPPGLGAARDGGSPRAGPGRALEAACGDPSPAPRRVGRVPGAGP